MSESRKRPFPLRSDAALGRLPIKPPSSASRRRSWLRRSLVSAVALFGLLFAALGGYALYVNGQITRIAVNGLTRGPADNRTENILLVGSTSRCALKKQNPAYGLCSQGVTGVNSDVVMILHLKAATHTVSILSIPRDTFVPNARKEGANKIDAALAEGPSQLVQAIEQDFGIPIQHYIQLNFETFAGVVDALGGVSMYFPQPVFDAYSGLSVASPGCKHLDGVQALQVVRARHLQHRTASSTSDPRSWPQETESDLARIRRNHEFLQIIAAAVAHQGLANLITDQRIVGAVAPKLEVDQELSTSHLVDLARNFHAVNFAGVSQLTLPIVATTFGAYHYKGGNYGDIVWPAMPEDRSVIREFLGLGPNTDTATGQPLSDPVATAVSVLNGTGKTNEASTTATKLKGLGFRIVHTGNTAPVGRRSETVVYAAQGQLAAAQSVADRLGGLVVLGVDRSLDTAGVQVTVVTGTNFTVQSPAPPTLTSHPAPNGTETAPSAPVEARTPYDPRSCTAAETPTP